MTDAPQRGKRKSAKQHKKLAALLADGTQVGEALLAAGYAQNTADKGWAAVPDAVMAQLPKKAHKLVALGKTDKEIRKHLIRGRLTENILSGKDGGAMSAKILGSDSEINMWTPDFQTGVIVLHAPQYALDHKEELLRDCEPVPDPCGVKE